MKKGIIVALTLVIAIMACGIVLAKGKPVKPAPGPELVLIILTGDLSGSAVVDRAMLSDEYGAEITITLSGPFTGTYKGGLRIAKTGGRSGNIYFHNPERTIYVLDGSVKNDVWTYVDDRMLYFTPDQGNGVWTTGNCVFTITSQ